MYNKLEVIKKNYPDKKYKDIEEKGYAYIIKVLEKLEKVKGEEYISGFDVICAVYPKKIDKKQKNLKGNFISCVQKQICVKNCKVIEKLKKVTFEELDEAIQEVDKEYDGINYSYEEVYNIECNYGNYYIDTGYYDYDFDLHTSGTRKTELNRRIEEAA